MHSGVSSAELMFELHTRLHTHTRARAPKHDELTHALARSAGVIVVVIADMRSPSMGALEQKPAAKQNRPHVIRQ